jgi:hypothetical protein
LRLQSRQPLRHRPLRPPSSFPRRIAQTPSVRSIMSCLTLSGSAPCGYPVCLRHIHSPHCLYHLPTQRPKAPTPSHFHLQVRVHPAASVGDTAAAVIATTIATKAAIPPTVNRRNISPSHFCAKATRRGGVIILRQTINFLEYCAQTGPKCAQ